VEPLSEEILFGKLKSGGEVKVDFIKDKFSLKVLNK
jgi:ATP-dependent Clp protease ATP-binding subunit ClpA